MFDRDFEVGTSRRRPPPTLLDELLSSVSRLIEELLPHSCRTRCSARRRPIGQRAGGRTSAGLGQCPSCSARVTREAYRPFPVSNQITKISLLRLARAMGAKILSHLLWIRPEMWVFPAACSSGAAGPWLIHDDPLEGRPLRV